MDCRWVVLLHQVGAVKTQRSFADQDHWDWMFQDAADREARLLTWATEPLDFAGLPWDPSKRDGVQIVENAIRLGDHRAVYLTKEGSISGQRGRVTRRLAGSIRGSQRNARECVFRCETDESCMPGWPVGTEWTLTWTLLDQDSLQTRLTLHRHAQG